MDATTSGVNQIMYQQDLRIQKGVKNKIQIQFKNSDQKLMPIHSSGTFVFSMFDAINQRLLLEKTITVLDDTVTANIVHDQLQISNTLVFSTGTTFTVGQSVAGFGIKPNSMIVSTNGNAVTLNNFTTYPVSSSTGINITTPALKGLGEIVFLETDTANLMIGNYTFTVKYLDNDGEFLPAYSNTYYGIAGTLHLLDDMFPVLTPSQTITSFLKTSNYSNNLYYYPSGNIYAYPEYNSNNDAVHTLAMYMTNFTGTVEIQATLNNQPDAQSYASITTLTYAQFNGIDYYNFHGVFTYIKIIYTPGTKPGESTNDNPTYFGSFDKVLYRS
jgi:hypothetical protein